MTGTCAREALAVALVVALAAACGDADDPYNLTDGEVVSDTTAYAGIDYDLTSDNYRKWLAANTALDSAGVQPSARLDPRRATDDDIDRVVDALSGDQRARAAIESADISVRDYVLTSVALAQSWDAIDRPGQVTGIPTGNAAFLRSQAAADTLQPLRPRAPVITGGGRGGDDDSDRRKRHDDRDSDSDKDSDKKRKRKGKG